MDTTDPDIPAQYSASVSQYTGVALGAGQTDNTRDFPFASALAKSVDKSVVTPPDTLTFTITPSYPGTAPLVGATVTDTVPTGTTFASALQGGVNVPPVTWSLGSTVAKVDGSGAASTARMATGSYTGNGVDNRAITGLGFQPDMVYIKARTARSSMMRLSTFGAGDATKDIGVSNGNFVLNNIQSLDADGFTIGTDVRVNENAVTYDYVAFKAAAGYMTVGTYTGNDGNPRPSPASVSRRSRCSSCPRAITRCSRPRTCRPARPSRRAPARTR